LDAERSVTSLSILIVNWNSKDLLRQCLLSIREHAADLTPQIIVVDGGSFDGCAELLAKDFPDVDFVQSNENIGFGRANNLGFDRASGEVLLLLNPDAELLPGALHLLIAELQLRPRAGMVGPRLLNTDHTLQTSVQAFPRPLRQAFDSELLRRLLWPLRLWAPPTSFLPEDATEVEATSGACMLVWSAVFRDVGGFTPQYFMYAEDVDLCLKISRKGLGIYHVPAAHVLHHGGASSTTLGTAFSAVMMRHALYTYMQLNHGRFHARLYRTATAVAASLKLVMVLARMAFSGRRRYKTYVSVASIHLSVISWSLGRQTWVKNFA
jgi:N-acetylglucosaminyl-diphospho-decaprenol L-rhamnosyltransferase